METAQKRTASGAGLIVLAFIAFISLGLPDGLLGVAWPSIRANFGQPLDALGMLLFASTSGYLTSSFLSGRAMARLGVGWLLALSCAATGIALLGYTLAPYWWVMVIFGVLGGLGAGAIDAGINTYIASEHGESLMQWLHASFGVGITSGPIIMTAGISAFSSWRWGYTLVGVAQITLALIFAMTAAMWKRKDAPAAHDEEKRLIDYKTPMRATLRTPAVWLSILLFFAYTGIELILGHWTYTLLTESRGIAPQVAGLWAGGYWATFTIGRILAGMFAARVRLTTLLRVCILGALAGAALVWWNPFPLVSLLGIALVGISVAPIFPGLVSLTSARVGAQHAANTIGMQIGAAGLGGALLPGFAGFLARTFSLEVIPLYLTALIFLLFLLYSLSLRGAKEAQA